MWQPNNSNVFDNNEVCDDGNNDDGDGCSADCKTIEDRWVCDNVDYDQTNCTYTACGNAYFDDLDTITFINAGVTAQEECDDGNTDDGDCCSSTCTLETGCHCSGYGAGTCQKVCRNGNVDTIAKPNFPYQYAYEEVCDEGEGRADTNGCSEDCMTVENLYKCDLPGGTECYLACGDGVLDDDATHDPPNSYDYNEICDEGGA